MNKKLIAIFVLLIFSLSLIASVDAALPQRATQPTPEKTPAPEKKESWFEKQIKNVIIKWWNEWWEGLFDNHPKIKSSWEIAKKVGGWIKKIFVSIVDAIKLVINLINSVFKYIPYGKYIALILSTILIVMGNEIFLSKLVKKSRSLPGIGMLLELNIYLGITNTATLAEKGFVPIFYYVLHYGEVFKNEAIGNWAVPFTRIMLPDPVPGALRFTLLLIVCFFIGQKIVNKFFKKIKEMGWKSILMPFGYGWLWGKKIKDKKGKLEAIFGTVGRVTGIEHLVKKKKIKQEELAKHRAVVKSLEESANYFLAKLYHEAHMRWSEDPEKSAMLKNYEAQLREVLGKDYKIIRDSLRELAEAGAELEEPKK